MTTAITIPEPMKVIVQIKSVYGNELIYPINTTAQQFAKLVGKKTLSRADLQIIKSLGFEIEHSQVTIGGI